MKRIILVAILGSIPIAFAASAESPFNGTWRPDPQRPEAGRPNDVIRLSHGEYECQTCTPPYRVAADGAEHPINGNPRFDSLSVRVVDDHTITRIARKGGTTILNSTVQVSANGKVLIERQIMSDAGPRPVDFTSHASRVSAGPAGSHLVSGTWHLDDADLTNHDEDTDYLVSDGFLSMTDRMGRSFKAKLDGTEAPYHGDSQFTSVSVKQIDPRTMEETDLNGGKAVKIARWSVDRDGKTMHVQFDDTHGHVQHQDGHKIR